ncbi:hypothetical protein CLOSTMETH_03747 [[Clostridium] methylpentosum DSM 5476]|uniref:Uncharacterized protein n=1 Tax=[Clostridium] methylpentosum DSM 5476 TaxID=537013 RepID=C0EIQ2_9FIRM|nr:hypothetical protein CLOSTMETH_03747 [[Clostridium] methylpentosum DSM 5476]
MNLCCGESGEHGTAFCALSDIWAPGHGMGAMESPLFYFPVDFSSRLWYDNFIVRE